MDKEIDNQSKKEITEHSKVNIKHFQKFIFIGLSILLLTIGVAGTYAWQQKKYDAESARLSSANSKLTAANKQIDGLNKEIGSLNVKIDKLLKPDSPPVPPKLTVTVDGASYFTPCICNITAVAVDITLKNNTSSTLNVVTGDFKLQDNQGNAYLQSDDAGAESRNLPLNWVKLSNQSLAPGQSVKGAIMFDMFNNSITAFTLVNGSDTYPVTALQK